MLQAKSVRRTRAKVSKLWMRRTRSRRRGRSEVLRENSLLNLHQTIGNQAMGRRIQAKLTAGRSGDQFEREADRVAEQVVNTPDFISAPTVPLAAGRNAPTLQRMAETEDDLRILQGPHELFKGPLEGDEPVIRRTPQVEGDEEPAFQMTPIEEKEDPDQQHWSHDPAIDHP